MREIVERIKSPSGYSGKMYEVEERVFSKKKRVCMFRSAFFDM